MKNNIIVVGTKVAIKRPDNTYSSFQTMFEALGFKDTEENDRWNAGDVGTVFAIAAHPLNHTTLVAVEDEKGRQCLITYGAVEPVEELYEFKKPAYKLDYSTYNLPFVINNNLVPEYTHRALVIIDSNYIPEIREVGDKSLIVFIKKTKQYTP
jgi:hypothetical protein